MRVYTVMHVYLLCLKMKHKITKHTGFRYVLEGRMMVSKWLKVQLHSNIKVAVIVESRVTFHLFYFFLEPCHMLIEWWHFHL